MKAKVLWIAGETMSSNWPIPNMTSYSTDHYSFVADFGYGDHRHIMRRKIRRCYRD